MSVDLFSAPFSTAPAALVMARAERAAGPRARLVATANLDHIVLLARDPDFRRAYRDALVRTLDGMPLVWLARLKGARGVHRVTGHDLLAHVLTAPAPADRRVFLVAPTATVGARVAALFVATGLAPEAVRTVVPPFGFDRDAAYSADLARDVRAHGTTLLVLGVGSPKSEVWIDRHAGVLGGPDGAPVCLSIGEALGVAAGTVARAPDALQRLGLEWLFRFANAPRRLFQRYFVRSWRVLAILATRQGRTMLAAPPAAPGAPAGPARLTEAGTAPDGAAAAPGSARAS